jgi:flagellar hook-associated protein 1 FlgK
MSLTSVLSTATSALLTTQFQISTVSDNISNASNAGATQKTYTPSSSASLTSSLSTGEVTRLTNSYLSQTVNASAGENGASSVVNTYLQSYDTQLGSTANASDVSSLLTSFQTALTTLGNAPTSTSDASSVVNAASTLARNISQLSAGIQTLRTQASSDIGSTVTAVNTDLSSLQSLNSQIAAGAQTGSDVTGLEDQRDTTLTDLSSMIGVQYFTTANNQLMVYDNNGDQLLGAQASTLSYAQTGALGASTTYAGGTIPGIELNGAKDITSALSGTGAMGGLIQLRDTTLVGQQDQLDQLATGLISTVNTAAGMTIFTGTDASTIGVSASLVADPSPLLNNATAISGTVAALQTTSQTLSANGTATAVTGTIASAAANFVSNAASVISTAATLATDNDTALSTAQNALSNATGISTDQQTALLTQYQNQYEAASELLTAVKSMFSTLITAMSAA